MLIKWTIGCHCIRQQFNLFSYSYNFILSTFFSYPFSCPHHVPFGLISRRWQKFHIDVSHSSGLMSIGRSTSFASQAGFFQPGLLLNVSTEVGFIWWCTRLVRFLVSTASGSSLITWLKFSLIKCCCWWRSAHSFLCFSRRPIPLINFCACQVATYSCLRAEYHFERESFPRSWLRICLG